MVDCDLKDGGCRGGLAKYANEYLVVHGNTEEKNYPYVPRRNTCNKAKIIDPAIPTNSMYESPVNPDWLTNWLAYSPISISIWATN